MRVHGMWMTPLVQSPPGVKIPASSSAGKHDGDKDVGTLDYRVGHSIARQLVELVY
jgi:hypothetical protein